MIDLPSLLREHPGHALPTQYRIGAPYGSTTVCFQNFYDQVFPGKDTPVDLYVLCFDGEGRQVAGERIRVGTGEALQYRADMAGSGLIASMAVPAFDLAEYNAGRLKLKRELGTGFYVIWEDGAGHLDTMHEWMQVRAEPLGEARHFFVFDAGRAELARVGLVVMNPCCGTGAAAQTRGALTLYTSERSVLGRAELPSIPPMGARLVALDELFPNVRDWFSAHGPLGASIEGVNLVEPLTAEFHVSGDLHLHHIN